MQTKTLQTNLDLVNLAHERRRWVARALGALLAAHIDGRLTADEHRQHEIDLRRADCAAYTPARKVTLIADCKAIVQHFGGQS